MKTHEIWHSLYDNVRKHGVDQFNEKQRDLFYFIDFIYQIEMGDFIYNQTPTTANENFYAPYVNAWKRFNMNELADQAALYNNQYLKAIQSYENNDKKDFEKYEKEFDLELFKKSFRKIIDRTYKDYEIVLNWIESNRAELIETLPRT